MANPWLYPASCRLAHLVGDRQTHRLVTLLEFDAGLLAACDIGATALAGERRRGNHRAGTTREE